LRLGTLSHWTAPTDGTATTAAARMLVIFMVAARERAEGVIKVVIMMFIY
jgi:hypothetical protein